MKNTQLSVCAERLERDGYIVVEDFFPVEDVIKAHDEIMAVYAADLAEREKQSGKEAFYAGPSGKSILTEPTHLLLDVYGKSPTLDLLFEKILTDEFSSELLRRLAGPQLKLRGYNSQRLTGVLDKAPEVGSAPNPHEWHRDSPGEICISIFLTDLNKPNMGATSLVPGSHRYPYCPRWSCLFGPPHRIKNGLLVVGNLFLRVNFFNRILGRFIRKRATGAYGNRGDFYIFMNDVWHGREPNTSGLPGIKFMVGAYPAAMPFPDNVAPPPSDVLKGLPPALRLAASQEGVPASIGETIIARTLDEQKKPQRLIFQLAKTERRMADWLAEKLL